MALTVATNTGALMAQAAASSVNKDMELSMERLSTGNRINGASDDAAGVAIASRLTSEIRGTNQAIRNAMDGQALIDTAEGAHQEVENLLQRMREIAVQAANDTNSASDRTSLQSELNQLVSEIDRISTVTTWAGQKLLTGSGGNNSNGTFAMQVGSRTNAADTITATIAATDSVTLGVSGKAVGTTELFKDDAVALVAGTATASTGTGNYTAAEGTDLVTVGDAADAASTLEILGVTITRSTAEGVIAEQGINGEAQALADAINADTTLQGLGISAARTSTDGVIRIYQGGNDISTATAAKTTISNIDTAISTLNSQRGTLGAISNRLDSTVSNLTNISSNLQAGRGRIEDADFAAETTNLAKSQILQQASTAMLAQANASKQNVLSLLQG
jgi:flagellin